MLYDLCSSRDGNSTARNVFIEVNDESCLPGSVLWGKVGGGGGGDVIERRGLVMKMCEIFY